MSVNCPGFKPQGVRPTKCRRCFKDITEHNIDLGYSSVFGLRRSGNSRSTLDITDVPLVGSVGRSNSSVNNYSRKNSYSRDQDNNTSKATDPPTSSSSSYRRSISEADSSTPASSYSSYSSRPKSILLSASPSHRYDESPTSSSIDEERRRDLSDITARRTRLRFRVDSIETKTTSGEKSDQDSNGSAYSRAKLRAAQSIADISTATFKENDAVSDLFEKSRIRSRDARLGINTNEVFSSYRLSISPTPGKKSPIQILAAEEEEDDKPSENSADTVAYTVKVRPSIDKSQTDRERETVLSLKQTSMSEKMSESEKINELQIQLKATKEQLKEAKEKVPEKGKSRAGAGDTENIEAKLKAANKKVFDMDDKVRMLEKELRELQGVEKKLNETNSTKLEELQDKVIKLEKENKDLQGSQATAQIKPKTSTKKITDLEEKVRRLETENKQLQEDLNRVKQSSRQGNELEEQVKKLEKEKELLDSQSKLLVETSSKLSKEMKEKTDHEERVKKLEKELAELQSKFKTTNKKVTETEEKATRLEKENKELLESQNKLKTSSSSSSSKLNEYEQKIQKLEKELKNFNESGDRLKATVKQLSDNEEKLKRLEKDNKDLQNIQTKLTSSNKQLVEYEEKIRKLEKEAKEFQTKLTSSNKEVSVLSKQLTEHTDIVKKLENQAKETTTFQSKLSSSNKQMTELEEKMRKLETEIKELKAEKDLLESQQKTKEVNSKEQNNKANKKLAEAEEKVTKLEKENKDLIDNKLKTSANKLAEYEDKIKRLEKHINTTLEDSVEAQQKVMKMEKEMKEKLDSQTKLQGLNANLNAKLSEAEEKSKKMEKENKELQESSSKLKIKQLKQVQDLEQKVKKLENDNKELQEANKELQEANKELSLSEDTVKTKKNQYEEKLKAVDQEKKVLQDSLNKLQSVGDQLNEAKERTLKLETEVKGLQESRAKLKTSQTKKLAEVEKEKEEAKEFEMKYKTSTKEVNDLKETIKRMETECKEHCKVLKESDMKLETTCNQLNELKGRLRKAEEESHKVSEQFETKLRAADEQLSEFREKTRKLEHQNKKLLEAQSKLETTTTRKLSEHEDKIERDTKEFQRLQSQFKATKESITEIEEKAEKLEKENRELLESENNLKTASKRLAECETKIIQLEKENKALNESGERLKETAKLVENLTKTKLEYEDKIKKLEKDSFELKAIQVKLTSCTKLLTDSEQKIIKLEKEAKELQNKLTASRTEATEAGEKVKKLEKDAKEAQNIQTKLTLTTKQLAENEVEVEALQSKLTSTNKQLSDSEEKLKKLETDNKELQNKTITFQNRVKSLEIDNKAAEKSSNELNRLKDKVKDLEKSYTEIKQEKALLSLRMEADKKKMETKSSPFGSNEVITLKKKLKEKEEVCEELQHENEEIKHEVKALATELEELHDTFREDQASEFRDLKRELEAASKNSRVLQFKLKKTERQCEGLILDKAELENKMKNIIDTSLMTGDKHKMREMEAELTIAKEVSLKLHSEIETLKEERGRMEAELNETRNQLNQQNNKLAPNRRGGKLSPAPTLSPQVSFDSKEKDYEEVVRNLYDSMEREKDIQEQLKFAEEESRTMRKKLGTVEQENEILMMQIRKMASKTGKSGKGKIEEESEELNPEEMKLHLELYEQEMTVLRKKTDELEQENDNMQQEIKYLQEKIVSTPLTKVEVPELPPNSAPNVIYEHKIRILETEARDLRKKMVDREKENESLRTEVDIHRRKASKVMVRSRSLEGEGQVDLKRHLQLVEQEASILRQKLISLEMDNEKLGAENKKLQLRVSRKPPPGPADKLQLENLELKEKLKELDKKCESFKGELVASKSSPNVASFLQDYKSSVKSMETLTENEADLISQLKRQVKSKERKITQLETRSAELELENARVNREYKKLKETLNTRRRPMRVVKETATRLELKDIVKELEEELSDAQKVLKARETIYNNLEEEMTETKRQLETIQMEVKNKENKLSEELEETKEGSTQLIKEKTTLQRKLDIVAKDKGTDLKVLDHVDSLEVEKKELAIRVDGLENELSREKYRAEEAVEKLNRVTNLKEELHESYKRLSTEKEKAEDDAENYKERMRTTEQTMKELKARVEDADNEVVGLSKEINNLKNQLEDEKEKAKAGGRRGSDTGTGFTLKDRDDLRKQMQELKAKITSLQREAEKQEKQHKDREARLKEEYANKLESALKEIRQEALSEKASLKEEGQGIRGKLTDLNEQLDRLAAELKEAQEKNRQLTNQARKEKDEWQIRLADQEAMFRSEQRKKEKVERENEAQMKVKDEEMLQTRDRVVQLERELRKAQSRVESVESEFGMKLSSMERENNKCKQEYMEMKMKHETFQSEYKDIKSRLTTEKDTLVEAISTLKRSYDDKLMEIKSLKESFTGRQEVWIKEKLDLQEKVTEMGTKAMRMKESDAERRRLMQVLEERDTLLEQSRRDAKHFEEENDKLRKKAEDLGLQVIGLEKTEKTTRGLTMTGNKVMQDMKIKMDHSETSHKGQVAAIHAEYEARMKMMNDEIQELQRQTSILMEERDQLRTRLSIDPDSRRGMHFRDEVEDLRAQMESLRAHLEQALLENRNLKVHHASERSAFQIQTAELKVKINQLDEQILMDSSRGATRTYAKTRLELAWDKERQEQQRLLQDTQKLIEEMKNKLLTIETLREKERSEARKQLQELKNIMDKEQEETQRRIGELQLDLIDLRDSHAKIRSQNERLKRERMALEVEREEWRIRLFVALDVQNKANDLAAEWDELAKIVPEEEKKDEDESGAGDSKRVRKRAPALNMEELRKALEKMKNKINDLKNVSLSKDDEKFKRAISFRRAISASDMNYGPGGGSGGATLRPKMPPLGSVMRAPPRPKALAKKSLSLDQNISSGVSSTSQDRIWESGDESLATTPASSITNMNSSNLRYGPPPSLGHNYYRAGYSSISGYESEGSMGGSWRYDPRYTREGSYGDRSDVSAPAAPVTKTKKTLKDKFKLLTKTQSIDDAAGSQGSLERGQEREKKESSLRSRISKTLKKTLGRSSDTLSKEQREAEERGRPLSLDYPFGPSYPNSQAMSHGVRPPTGPESSSNRPSSRNSSKREDPKPAASAGKSGTLPRSRPETRV